MMRNPDACCDGRRIDVDGKTASDMRSLFFLVALCVVALAAADMTADVDCTAQYTNATACDDDVRSSLLDYWLASALTVCSHFVLHRLPARGACLAQSRYGDCRSCLYVCFF